jgi:ABC transport system ATP-binding/permease protein
VGPVAEPTHPEGEGGRAASLPEGQALIIGRGTDADIPVESPEVSRRHAALLRADDGCYLCDLGSKNGTWVDGRRLEPEEWAPLLGGESVRFGPAEFRYDDGDLLPPSEKRPGAIGVVDRVVAGRDPDCDLVLPHPGVSRRHCVIERDADGWVLRDGESSNGTLVNGERCEEARLQDGDVVQIGMTRLVFEGGALRPVGARRPVRVDVRHLSRHVSRRGRRMTLLSGVNFTVYPNELLAIIGPSGAGKTTLINALNGMRPADEGAVLYNGVPFYENMHAFRTAIGYVPQEDIVHRELPVHSVLKYAARLRLPADTADEDVEALIEEVLAELDLGHRRDAVVSTLSGGERKRVNIGVELLTRPSLLLLDEPTSGLDPGLERRVVALIRRLTEEGRTILFVTHATESIAQCDLVLFLSHGQVAFFGPPRAALEFFQVDEFAEAYLKLSVDGEEDWPERFRKSSHHQEYVVERRETPVAPGAAPAAGTSRPVLSPFAQFKVLARRYAEVMKGDPRNLLILLLQAPFIALILSLIYKTNTFSNDLPTIPGAYPPVRKASELLFLIVIAALWFGTVNSAREVTKERAIFLRERLVNLRIWPYLFSKMTVLSLLCALQSFLLLGIVGLRVPFTPESSTWWLMLLTLFLTSLAATLQGLVLSSATNSTDQSMSLVPVMVLPQVIFSGMLISLGDLGPLRAVANIMPGRWAYGGLANLADLPDLFAQAGIARMAKDVFDTDPANALVALVLICAACLLAAGGALTLKERR